MPTLKNNNESSKFFFAYLLFVNKDKTVFIMLNDNNKQCQMPNSIKVGNTVIP